MKAILYKAAKYFSWLFYIACSIIALHQTWTYNRVPNPRICPLYSNSLYCRWRIELPKSFFFSNLQNHTQIVCMLRYLSFLINFLNTKVSLKGIFMYVTNMAYFGHLKSSENYKTDRKHNDMYELFNNRLVSRFSLMLSSFLPSSGF